MEIDERYKGDLNCVVYSDSAETLHYATSGNKIFSQLTKHQINGFAGVNSAFIKKVRQILRANNGFSGLSRDEQRGKLEVELLVN